MNKLIPWTSSKQEIYKAYKDVCKKYEEELAGKPLNKSTKSMQDKVKSDLNERLAGATPESIVDGISRMKKTVNKVLDNLSLDLVEETKKLHQTKQLLKQEEEDLEKLHDKSIVTLSIENLIDEYEHKNIELEKKFEEKKASLQDEIEKSQALWNIEKENYNKELADTKKQTDLQRSREQENYEYQFKIKKQKNEDEFTLKKASLEKELLEKQEEFDNNLRKRELDVNVAEAELKRLQDLEKHHTETMKEIKAKVTQEITEKLETKYKHEIALLQQSKEAGEKIYENRIQSLESYLQKQDQQIETLNQKFDLASSKVQEIAAKAIDGASGVNTLGAVNKIALEQAKINRGSTSSHESQ